MSAERQPVPLKERLRKRLKDLEIEFRAFVRDDPYAQQLYSRSEQAKHPEKWRARDVAAGMTTKELEEKLGVR